MRLRKNTSSEPYYSPVVETDTHKEMFAYYSSLGKERSLVKVAKQFGKSTSLISAIARAFKWRERLLQAQREITDPVVKLAEAQIADSRTKLIFVINDITDTLYQFASISRSIKDGEDDPALQDRRKISRLKHALEIYGVSIKNSKDLKDLVGALKDVVKFNESEISAGVDGKGSTFNTQVNADEVHFHIVDDELAEGEKNASQ